MPLTINFGRFVKRKINEFIERIKDKEGLLDNNDIRKEFNNKNYGILKKEGLNFLIKEFKTFNQKKAFESILLINIGYLSYNRTSNIFIEDIDFMNFIIKNLIPSDEYMDYGFISLHLLLNIYVKYERSIQGYNNYFFKELIKEISDHNKEKLYQKIIEGVIEKKKIKKNPNKYFETLNKYLTTDYESINEITYNLFFDKIFKADIELLKKFEKKFLEFIESNILHIFQKENVFTIFKHIYINLYNGESELFKKIDIYLQENIDKVEFLEKILDFISNFMPGNGSHPFYKKFYKKYFNLSYQLKEQRNFHALGSLWNLFNIHGLKDPETGELMDRNYFKQLLNDFKIVLHSGESKLFNARYMELEELVGDRPKIKPIKIFKKTKKIIIEIKGIQNSRPNEFHSNHPEYDNELNKQLKQLDFWNLNSPLSKNAETWLEIIGKYFDLLRIFYDRKELFREPAQNWRDERKNMNPWMSWILTLIFQNRHKDHTLVSDGDSDHWVDEIPIEDKLLRTREKLNKDNIIEEKYNMEKNQVLREAGKSGYVIFEIADIRDEIKTNELPALPLKKCFQIFYENDIWIAVFIFQAFTETPSKA
ncbi:hypothetical protein LCGC14_0922350 [marine sediment metagenome]|uniref:Uncharacterized protein n=1 Tax=marine sediment metagenome TaxID=412755 RepID=A0A0F9NV64_9ZZZZ